MLLTGFIYYKIRYIQHQELKTRYENVYSEFRTLKRRIALDEKIARQ